MLAEITRRWKGLTHRLSRPYWTQKLLRLPSESAPASPGLVMIQIDGLSRRELEDALARGRMPFLAGLRREAGYRLEDFYSGIPSTTPAVQAEIFYGVAQAVPAFSYIERATGRRRRFYEAGAARAKEAELAARAEGLLTGGSAYGDIYTGGAAEAHFCIADMGWDRVVRRAGAPRLMVLALTHLYSFVRMLAVGLVEFGHAVLEADPLTYRRHWLKELKFIPTRVGLNAMLREFQVMGARVDIARGRPVIHLNFLGYDENAHRRGPGTAFARRPLRGIDDAIARIHRAAARGPQRDYQVWIYSDHGQERVASFAATRGESFEAAVTRLVAELAPNERGPAPGAAAAGSAPQPADTQLADPYSAGAGEQSQRIDQLGAPRVVGRLPRQRHADTWPGSPAVSVTAMGPLGHIYLGAQATATLKSRLAQALIDRLGVPLVVVPPGQVGATCLAVTRSGRFSLPADGAAVLGSGHPLGVEAAADLAALAEHPDSGDLIVSGWRPAGTPLSFPVEGGAHGGPGADEALGFCLLPGEAPAPRRTSAVGRDYHRGADLRLAALRLLGRSPVGEPAPAAAPAPAWHRPDAPCRLRVVTYNVHSCRGLDGRLSPQRIASVLAQLDPDIVALQELDVGRPRSGGVDQAAAIAAALNMEARFHPAFTVQEEAYGDAILTHLPVRDVATTKLPRPRRDSGRAETRGALAATLSTGAGPLRVVTTHLGLRAGERRRQVEALMASALVRPARPAPAATLVLGDFNAGLARAEMAPLHAQLRDVVAARRSGDGRRRTFFAALPALSIDHIFVDPATTVHWAGPWRSEMARLASDHLPLVADIELAEPTDDGRAG